MTVLFYLQKCASSHLHVPDFREYNLVSDSCTQDLGYFHQTYYIHLDTHLSKYESRHVSCKIRYQTPLTFYRSNTCKSFFLQS